MPLTSIEQFLHDLLHAERSIHTVKNYRYDLIAFRTWLRHTRGEELEPYRATLADLRAYKHFLHHQRGLKPSSVNRKLAALKSYFQWAIKTGFLEAGDMPSMPQPVRETKQGPRWLGRHEQRALLRAVQGADNPRDRAIITILLNTGLRVQELCDLNWQDVRIIERKGAVTVRNGKGAKYRQVPLNHDARQAFVMLGYQAQAEQHRPIFWGQLGPLTPRGIQSIVHKHTKAAGLHNVSPHSFRHTFCKNLINVGVSLEKVAILVGHERLDTTRRYCEPSLIDLEQAVGLLEEGV